MWKPHLRLNSYDSLIELKTYADCLMNCQSTIYRKMQKTNKLTTKMWPLDVLWLLTENACTRRTINKHKLDSILFIQINSFVSITKLLARQRIQSILFVWRSEHRHRDNDKQFELNQSWSGRAKKQIIPNSIFHIMRLRYAIA